MALQGGPGRWPWEVILGGGPGKWSWEVALGDSPGRWSWEVALGVALSILPPKPPEAEGAGGVSGA